MKHLSLLVAPALLAAGCATDPARHLEPNEQDVEITPDGHFIRGDEHLDEEEFYSLVGDEKATEKIRADRAQGELFQPLGIGVGIGGIALAVGGYGLFYLAEHPSNADAASAGKSDGFATAEVYGGYIGMLGGLAAAVGGGYLWYDGHNRALGQTPLFDPKYAQNSLETARYGSGGATQSTVASLALATKDGAQTFCTVGGAVLAPLKAFDEKHRGIKLDASRAGWFQWSANPPEALSPGHDAVISPTATSLAALGNDVIVTVKVDAPTNVAATLDLKPDYGCPKRWFAFGGDGGAGGESGQWGQNAGSDGQSGGAGGPGGQGGDGGRGRDVEVEVTTITGPKGERLVLAAIEERGARGAELAVFDPQKAGPLVVAAEGGPGGNGGGGGSGGSGWSYGSGDTCKPGGAGGNGGSGGSGGRGGDGGTVHIRADSQAALQAIQASVAGGNGGYAGQGGSGGTGGDGDSCGTDRAARGPDGAMGASGSNGSAGRSGHVDARVAPKGSLRLIAAALATRDHVALGRRR